jgi:hypothetical protein
MASRVWSEAELSVVQQCAATYDLAAASQRLNERTRSAIKVKMSRIRAQLGFEDGRRERGGKDDQEEFNQNAVVGSQQLLVAIQRAGVQP